MGFSQGYFETWQNYYDVISCPGMTNPKLKEVIARVRRWPEMRQQDAACLLETFEAQAQCPLQLNDAQVAEIQRRLALSAPRLFTIDAVRSRVLS